MALMDRRAAGRTLLGFVGVFGVGYVVTLPPFGWGDEVPHYLRALRISRGQALPELHDGRRGARVSVGVQRLLPRAGLAALAWKDCSLSPRGLRDLFDVEATEGSAFAVEYGAPYPPIASLHTGAAIAAARSVSTNPLVWLYGARLANLSVWAALGLLALRVAPEMRTTLLVLMLGPTALFLAATCSVDGLLAALAFLWTACVLRLAQRPDPSPRPRDWVVVLGLVAPLGLVKLVYSPLALLLLIVPAAGTGARWRPWLALCATSVAFAVLLPAGWLAIVGASTEAIVFDPPTGAAYEPTRLLSDVAGSAAAIPRTIAAESYPWLINLAWPQWTQCTVGYPLTLPLLCGALLAAAATDASAFQPTLSQRMVGAAVFASTLSVSILAALAVWTPAAESRAAGVHGRYLLPALPALAIALLPPGLNVGSRSRRRLAAFAVVALAVSAALVEVAFVRQYDLAAPVP